MDTGKLRFILALVITAGYVVLVGIVIVAIVGFGFDRASGVEIIEEVSKVMAGFIGLIIGYYFSRASSGGEATSGG